MYKAPLYTIYRTTRRSHSPHSYTHCLFFLSPLDSRVLCVSARTLCSRTGQRHKDTHPPRTGDWSARVRYLLSSSSFFLIHRHTGIIHMYGHTHTRAWAVLGVVDLLAFLPHYQVVETCTHTQTMIVFFPQTYPKTGVCIPLCPVIFRAYIHVTLDHYPKPEEDLYCKYYSPS